MSNWPMSAYRRVRYAVKTRIQHALARVNERPVFVIGNQKSGTSAIVCLLAAAAGKQATNDIFTWYPGAESDVLAGRLRLADFVDRARHQFSRDFVKDPSLTFMLPALEARFPQARYVFVVRDPRVNIRGILNRVGLGGDVTALEPPDRQRIGASRPGWLPVLMGEGLVSEGTLVERLAHRCRIAMEIAAAARGRWPVIRYEDFVADKAGTIASALEAIGERAAHDISAVADTPFQPPSSDRSSPERFFSPENLARIETVCRATMDQFGYP